MKLARGSGALSNRGFFIYSIGSAISSLGLWVQRLALGWLAWQLSHSELWVGVIAFSLFGPILFFSALAGVLVDRLEPLRTAMAVNMLMGGWAVLLALLSIIGVLDIWLLFLVSVAIGLTSAAYAPVRLSIIPSIVPRELLGSAIGISSMIFNASRLIGPAIAGLVLVTLPIAAAFAINALSYIPLIFALSKVPPRAVVPRSPEGFFEQLGQGFVHAGANRFIRIQLLLTSWAALFGRSILEVLPVYADRFYASGAMGLAALSGAAGGGALLVAFITSRLVLDSRQMQLGSIIFAIVTALALMLLPFRDSLWFGLACVALIGFGSTGSAVLSQTLVQLEVEDRLRGRVSSLWSMANLGGAAFGGLALGALLQGLGITAGTIVTASLALALPLLVWHFVRDDPPPAAVSAIDPQPDEL